MDDWRQKLRAYAELGRVSNLPTVLANVLTGCAIGLASAPQAADMPWLTVLAVTLGIGLFYLAGMALNDAADVAVDRAERPDRPIPSGRVSLRAAYIFIIVGFVGGLCCIAPFGWPAVCMALALVAAIVLYDVVHKRYAWSVVLMGSCRGLVYLTAAAAVAWPIDWTVGGWLAVTITLYTLAITLVARAENRQTMDVRRWIAPAMPVAVLLALFIAQPAIWWHGALAGGAMTGWLSLAAWHVFKQPPQTIKAILTWLSGMALVDAYFLALLDQPMLALLAACCFALTAWGHRHILGT